MNAQLSIFNFQNHTVRIEIKDNEPLFCLTDIAEVLEITNPHATRFNLNLKGIHNMYTLTKGGKQELTFIDEANLYRVIFKSRKAEAIKFQDWIFEEVIPAIRKTGSYINQDKVKRCYELANTVASKVAQDTFNKLMCSDEETIAGRWWVATGWRNGEPIATSGLIPRNAHIATLEELADRIERGDGFIATKPEEFAKLAHACMNAISRRINYLTTN